MSSCSPVVLVHCKQQQLYSRVQVGLGGLAVDVMVAVAGMLFAGLLYMRIVSTRPHHKQHINIVH
jgi:hypothetical protein